MLVEIDRGEKFKTWRDDVTPAKKMLVSALAPVHYESVRGSGDFDKDHNLTAKRVNNARLNGFLCTDSTWHYAIQTQPKTGTQSPRGTVAFGGLRGKHFFKFRLRRMGYIHGPTRAVTPIGGAANYSTAPVGETITTSFGPEARTLGQTLEWRNLWTSPNGGEVYIRWLMTSGGLKEEIVVTQLAREYIFQPDQLKNITTPLDETFFGFQFDVDFSDVPKIWNNGSKTPDDDFDDESEGTELRDAQDNLLAFMPIENLYVPGRGGRVRLKKRFFKAGGQTSLFVGAKVSEMQSDLLPGDLIFDPSISVEIATNTDNSYTYNGIFYFDEGGLLYIGEFDDNIIDVGLRWAGFTQIDAGSTIDNGTKIILYGAGAGGATPEWTWYADLASSAAWSTSDRPDLSNVTETTASVLDSTGELTDNASNDSPELKSIVQEIVDTNGNTSAIRFVAIGGNLTGGNDFSSFDSANSANPAILEIVWTEAGGTEFFQTVEGVLTPVGALTTSVIFGQVLAGGLVPSGALVKQTQKNVAGIVAPGGTLIKSTQKSIAGTLSFAGALSQVLTFVQSVSGALIPAGALPRRTGKLVEGSLPSSGAITKKIGKNLAGTLSFEGTINRLVSKNLAGTLSFTGSLVSAVVLSKTVAGVLGFVGTIATLFTPAGAGPALRRMWRSVWGRVWKDTGTKDEDS